jgi:hypothetical protein
MCVCLHVVLEIGIFQLLADDAVVAFWSLITKQTWKSSCSTAGHCWKTLVPVLSSQNVSGEDFERAPLLRSRIVVEHRLSGTHLESAVTI